MTEKKLTGNEMFEVVKDECERILGKVENRGKRRRKGVLFFINRNWKVGWYEDGDEKKDGKYVGEIENRKPNGQGTYTWSDGRKYEGEFEDGIKHGQGTFTFSWGEKYVGKWKNGEKWNGTQYDKDGNITKKYVNGVKQK